MASIEDAVSGWGIYGEREGAISRTQLNQALQARGKQPISPRMFRHYGKLSRLGYSEYVSINRLDIRHANDSAFDLSDRSRYGDQEVLSPATLLIPTASKVVRLPGQVVKVSEGFATLRVPVKWKKQVETAAKANKYDKGILVFDQVGVERAVEVVETHPRDPNDAYVEVLLSFRSLLETDLVVLPATVEIRGSTLRINLGPSPSLFEVVQTMHSVFDLLESVRAFSELALHGVDGLDSPLPATRIQKLEVTNPFQVDLISAFLSTGVVSAVLTLVIKHVKDSGDAVNSWATAKNTIDEGTDRKQATQQRNERHAIEIESLQLDRIKKAIEVNSLLQELGAVGDSVDDDHTRAKLELLKDQAVHAAGELVVGSDDVQYEVDEPEAAPDEPEEEDSDHED